MSVRLLEGDCRETLRGIASDSIDSCVTDPPYALVSIVKRFGALNAAPARGNEAYMRASAGFTGQQWDTGECAMSPAFWAEVWRVLKPGAFLVAFGATRGYHRMACAIEDAGFEIRDSLAWLYGTGFPKSHNVSKGIDKAAGVRGHDSHRFNVAGLGAGYKYKYKSNGGSKFRSDHPDYVKPTGITSQAAEWDGWGTALKPAFEPIVLARKPLSEPTVAANVLRWRTGALNIDASRIGLADGEQPYSYPNGAGGSDPNHMWRGQKKGDGQVPQSGNANGRWPANVCHDGSAEVVEAFPQSAGQQGVVDGQTSRRNVYNNGVGPRPRAEPRGDSGSAARFFYSAKASKADRAGSKHPTVKPVSLMQWLARLTTPPGGTVLDPFAGSGTTGAACALEGFNAILCEREAQYVADIKRRLNLQMPWDAPPKTPFPWNTP